VNTVGVGEYPFIHIIPHKVLMADRCTVEFGKNVYRPWNLDMFFETYSPDQVGVIPTLISVEGGWCVRFLLHAW
jgi:hypothetical protein